ncbi:MAG: hypothetical protein V1815_00355 [Candidatus Woesearchaeota archaeon]
MKKYYKFLKLIIIVLILNLIWEFSHYSLYVDMSGLSKNYHLIQASFIDLIIIAFIFLIISIKNKNTKWIEKPSLMDYSMIIILGLIIAIIIELRALSIGRWIYIELMPTIFGIGLSPLIQLAITFIISLQIIKN